MLYLMMDVYHLSKKQAHFALPYCCRCCVSRRTYFSLVGDRTTEVILALERSELASGQISTNRAAQISLRLVGSRTFSTTLASQLVDRSH